MSSEQSTVRHVGFTGTQVGMTTAQRNTLTDLLKSRSGCLHHGDCLGADAEAHEIARTLGWRITLHPPSNRTKRAFCTADWTMPEADYLARNHFIVAYSEELVAAPKSNKEE